MDRWDDQTPEAAYAAAFAPAVRAVKEGDVAGLAALLAANPGLARARSAEGRTLLHHLCDYPGRCPRLRDTGRLLLTAGADVDARAIDPQQGETALQWAASNDDTATVELLLDAGASVDGLDDDRRPLAQAIWYGCTAVVQLLLARGASLDLELAAGTGRVDLLPSFFADDGTLLAGAGRHRPPVNGSLPGEPGQDERLAQALVYAVLGGSVEAAAYLLGRGADVNARPSGFGRRGGWRAQRGACRAAARARRRPGADGQPVRRDAARLGCSF
ncbi:ankyrin repeat domain-containing protein [Paenibacillus athensensis]|uniref:ankyrin repeat domain-containing protein n=1 Tax=Paenibacillus athensensis TaxID=1967502 RepID=UPI001E2D2D76|nr:ankyrin repeat domain-containing protein [Paenibacillus athensensis]MCD1258016.1 ankyrin repeat domain-containing protein [Paenibacillus athensensis]